MIGIADIAGGHWPEIARQAALALSMGDPDEGSYKTMLLHDIGATFTAKDMDRISTDELIGVLLGMAERPWGEISRGGKPMTARKLATLLKPFEVWSQQIRFETTTLKGYYLSDFEDVFLRYLHLPSETSETTAENSHFSRLPSETTPLRQCQTVSDGKAGNPQKTAIVSDVSDGKRGNGAGYDELLLSDAEVEAEERSAIQQFDGGDAP